MSSSKILLFLLALTGLAACQGNKGGGSSSPQETRDLLVCTFNIRYIEPADGANDWDHRKDAVCSFILTRKPDVIGLQEVEKESAQYIYSKVKDEYGFYGVGPEKGKDLLTDADPASAPAILYRKTRFDLSAKGVFWHSDTPDQVVVKNKANDYGSWHTTHPRNTVWVKLIDNERLGRTVWLFNTHYQNNKNISAQAPGIRLLESNLHLNKIPQITGGVLGTGCKDAVFLLGDFNCASSEESLQTLINYPLGYARLDAKKSSFRTANTDNGFGSGGGLIDHIFFSGPLNALLYSLDKRDYGATYISDHYPVLTEFSYTD